MGAAIRFITSAPAPVDHMIGTSPKKAQATVMTLGRTRLTAPCMMASFRSSRLRIASGRLRLVVGEVEVQEHEDAGLGVESQQGDQADPDADRDVVAEGVEQPDRADRGKGHGEQHDERLRRGTWCWRRAGRR